MSQSNSSSEWFAYGEAVWGWGFLDFETLVPSCSSAWCYSDWPHTLWGSANSVQPGARELPSIWGTTLPLQWCRGGIWESRPQPTNWAFCLTGTFERLGDCWRSGSIVQMSLKVSHWWPESYFVKMTDGLQQLLRPAISRDVSPGLLVKTRFFCSSRGAWALPGQSSKTLAFHLLCGWLLTRRMGTFRDVGSVWIVYLWRGWALTSRGSTLQGVTLPTTSKMFCFHVLNTFLFFHNNLCT